MIYHKYSINILKLGRSKHTMQDGEVIVDDKDDYYLNGYSGELFVFTCFDDLKEQLHNYFSPGIVRVELDPETGIEIEVTAAANNMHPVDDGCLEAFREGKCCLWSFYGNITDEEISGAPYGSLGIAKTRSEIEDAGREVSNRLRQAWNALCVERGDKELTAEEFSDIENVIMQAFDWDAMNTPDDESIRKALHPYSVSTFSSLPEAYSVIMVTAMEEAQERYDRALALDKTFPVGLGTAVEEMLNTIVWDEDVCFVSVESPSKIIVLHIA